MNYLLTIAVIVFCIHAFRFFLLYGYSKKAYMELSKEATDNNADEGMLLIVYKVMKDEHLWHIKLWAKIVAVLVMAFVYHSIALLTGLPTLDVSIRLVNAW